MIDRMINMNSLENSEEKKKYSLDDFRKDISEIAEAEAKKGETADFSGKENDFSGLSADDMNIWLKILDDSITQKDFEEYRKIYEKEKGYDVPARHGFFSLAGNKANGIIGRRWMEEEKAKTKNK